MENRKRTEHLSSKSSKFNVLVTALVAPLFLVTFVFIYYLQGQATEHELMVTCLIGVLLIVIVSLEINHYKEWTKNMSLANTLLSGGMVLLMVVIYAFGPNIDTLYYLVPIAAHAVLITFLVQERFALVSSVLMAIIGANLLTLSSDFNHFIFVFIYFLFSQWFAIFLYDFITDRISLFKTSIPLIVLHIALVLTFEVRSFDDLVSVETVIALVFAVLSIFISAILILGLFPLFEAGLNLLTESKLLSLANPNHPLLKQILVESPGTYHHSVMVANLSESACEAIGANGLLARVAAYYHDIGKSFQPHYFIENQQNMSNPHDELDPKISAEIILKHPYEGAAILRDYGLPGEIIDITEQHHGTTLLKYFYYQEKETDPNVREEQFRYLGPIPQSKESAVINICDSVEAAVRSKSNPTLEEIRQVVRAIIHARLTDGQLDDSQLTLKDLRVIEESICDMLNGIFHSRIEYPEIKDSQVAREDSS
ncbi:putative nucleotidyltransferase with HDIG domain [Alkalibacillus filiformis]|uniref:Nucleotidyltransferase with HDIG domain n=1 Tax=Alkalibacillus filiformis TaxID=200990 RepID=A0ABU0DRJ8_9BACI|nr:HDIG domain-containing metalloprotein [Alkalibacillus filiformis]MDQ0351057.1 putative nucleotidyltransferase with HDIG domain [Alkalibacillus filiformis]